MSTWRELIAHIFSGRWLGSTDVGQVTTVILWAVVIGLLASGLGVEPVLWALGALASGGLVGFLFGIPRVDQSPDVPAVATGDLTDAAGGAVNGPDSRLLRRYRQRVNTNLEEISDWLTKIIVALGLVQLGQIPAMFESLVRFLAADKYSLGLVGSILVFFGVVGFFGGYLLTRLYLAGAFSRADQLASVFNEGVKRLTEEAPQDLTALGAAPAPNSAEARLRQLVPVSPRAVVMDCWRQLEQAAAEAIRRKTGETPRRTRRIVQRLAEQQIVSSEQAGMLRELGALRDVAVAASEDGITVARAEDYVTLAARLTRELEQIH